MRIVYCPIRGSVYDSFYASSAFNSLKECFDSLSSSCPVNDLSLHYYGFDDRYRVDSWALCTISFEGVKYDHPQIVGFVYFGLTKACMSRRLYDFFNKE